MRFFQFRSLQSRIFVFFFLLILVTQLGSILITSTLGLSIVNKTLSEELNTGERGFNRLFEQNTALITQGARILAADYGFRDAISSKDAETIVSALDNHGDRIKADLMLFVDIDGRIISSSTLATQSIDAGELGWLDPKRPQNKASALIERINGKLYQLIAVTVSAPLPIGSVVVGFRIDEAQARDISKITNTEVSYVSQKAPAGWQVNASTLPPAPLDTLQKALAGKMLKNDSITLLPTEVGDYLSLRLTLSSPAGQQTVVILQKSLDDSLAPFLDLRGKLLFLGVIGLILSGLSSFAIARSITRPIKKLAHFAQNIAQGNYTERPDIKVKNEIADLADSFDHMSTEIASRESRIMDLAYRDTLTGLPNRTMFHDRLNQAIHTTQRVGKPLTIMLMDLDRFKYVNDSLGHHIGDLLLQEVAQRLLKSLPRKSDTVARLGGDEFVVLLPTDDIDHAQKVARTLLAALEAPMMLEGQMLDMRGSIGLASAPLHGNDSATLLRCADIAMYQAKRNNSGYAEYDVSFDHNTLEHLSLMSELREAVEHNQLTLYYQPKVNLNHSSTHAVEALVRWIHPQRGFVPPDKFIPFAEQTGYIKAITAWVLNEGVAQCAEWSRKGLEVSISINISARDLLNVDLPTYFSGLLEQYGCQADKICLEITESAILDDPDRALDNLKRLEAIGCKLSVDDYGTGYSSLAYLKRLPVGELKIDRSFVMNMTNDPNDVVIVRSTIDLAHNLGLRVVAEGVETEEILNQLCLLGCDQAQGYLFSKPVPADDFYAWAESQSGPEMVRRVCKI